MNNNAKQELLHNNRFKTFGKVVIDKLPSENYYVGMLYTYSELKNMLGGYPKVKAAIENGEYFKVSHGIYSDKSPDVSELENIFLRYPNAVLTLESAFAFYELTDYVPDKYIVATGQKAHRIQNKKVEQLFITDNLLTIGKTSIKTKYGRINIYDKERMLIELFRLRNKISYSLFKEVINSYRELIKEDAIDNNKIIRYCSYFKNGKSIRNQIQEVVL